MLDLAKIPLVFWIGLSISISSSSLGITYSLIRGSNLEVEALNSKLSLDSKIDKTKELAQELQEASEELYNAPQAPKKIYLIQQELEKTESELKELEEEIIEESKPETFHDEEHLDNHSD